jgi:hypothetical protein
MFKKEILCWDLIHPHEFVTCYIITTKKGRPDLFIIADIKDNSFEICCMLTFYTTSMSEFVYGRPPIQTLIAIEVAEVHSCYTLLLLKKSVAASVESLV